MIRRAADTGKLDNIMADLQQTRELTQYCHDRGIAVEAEPGRVQGGEDGISDTADLAGLLTTAAEAREFVGTGIDWLGPAFRQRAWRLRGAGIVLEYDRLAAIDKAVGHEVRLVMPAPTAGTRTSSGGVSSTGPRRSTSIRR